MKTTLRPLALLAAAALLAAPALADVTSTFDSSLDGWTLSAADAGSTLAHSASGGNPGGRAVFTDAALGADDLFAAPAPFLGNRTAFYNGTLSFQLLESAGGDDPTAPVSIIDGAGHRLTHTLTPFGGGAFTPFSLTLNEVSGWSYVPFGGSAAAATRAQFHSVLGHVAAVQIPADVHFGPSSASLDNVRLALAPGRQLFEEQSAPDRVSYTLANGFAAPVPFDITLFAVSTGVFIPQDPTAPAGWSAQALAAADWTQPIGGVSNRPTWAQFTGRAFSSVFAPGDAVLGYYVPFTPAGDGTWSYIPQDPVKPGQALAGFSRAGLAASDFIAAGPGDAATFVGDTDDAVILGVEESTGTAILVPEPGSAALLLLSGAALLLRRRALRTHERNG